MFFDQADILDPHGLFSSLGHIVDGQGRHGDRGQSFHFNAGLANRFCRGRHHDTRQSIIQHEIHIHFVERQGVTQRDEFGRPFGCADSGDLCHRKYITLLHLPGADQFQGFPLHMDFATSHCRPLGIRLMTDIHHAGAALFIEMCKLIWHAEIISYAASHEYNSTSMENLLNRQLNYTVRTPTYEGPLDLLLDLIERAELDITTVSLAAVTDQYLAYIESLEQANPDEISAFLVIAAKLLQIKSEALLPRPPARAPGEEDAGRALVDQLKLYKRFKEIGNLLNDRQKVGLRTYVRVAPAPKVEPKLDLSNLSLESLVAAAQEAFARERNKQPLAVIIAPPRVTIREKIDLITRVMKEAGRATFRTLLNPGASRLEIVVTFLAMLELVKRYRIQATQEGLFSDIEIHRTADWQDDGEIEIEFE
jgi:segregation and condensation protein A